MPHSTCARVLTDYRVCVKELPKTLVVHLKRFEFDMETMQRIKVNDYYTVSTLSVFKGHSFLLFLQACKNNSRAHVHVGSLSTAIFRGKFSDSSRPLNTHSSPCT